MEILFKDHINDRTNWRAMLKGEVDLLDLEAERDALDGAVQAGVAELRERFGLQAVAALPEESPRSFNYPVLNHPAKVVSHNPDKNPLVEGTLEGIKGQYLIFDTGVINMRKFGGYHMALNAL